MTLRLGAHVGQQNMSMNKMRETWRLLDEHLDWISAWDHLYEAPPAGLDIEAAGFGAFLLKTMQHIHRLRKLRDIQNTKSTGRIADADFADTGPDTRHRLPVVRVQSALHAVKLKPRHPAGSLRKRPQRIQRIAMK